MARDERAQEMTEALLRYYDSGVEDGRREVWREIATLPPQSSEGCWFCGERGQSSHKGSCLWVRAQEAIHEPV